MGKKGLFLKINRMYPSLVRFVVLSNHQFYVDGMTKASHHKSDDFRKREMNDTLEGACKL